jgi:hypothetical protein
MSYQLVVFFSCRVQCRMKQKGETSFTPKAKYAKYAASTPSFSLGKNRSEYKQRCSYVHYGFLVIEWICAHGIPLDLIEMMEGKLVGPDSDCGPTLKQWKKKMAKEHPEIYTCEMTDENRDNERVKIEERSLSTWIPHALFTEFMKDCEVSFVFAVSLLVPQLVLVSLVVSSAMQCLGASSRRAIHRPRPS